MVEFQIRAIEAAARADVDGLAKAHISYGDSWKKRGGVGAFMMLARKWDRLENAVKKHGYDIFTAIEGDTRAEGIMDDIRDLRRYLLLVEAEFEVPQVQKDDSVFEPATAECAPTCLSRKWDPIANRQGGCTCGALKGKAIGYSSNSA